MRGCLGTLANQEGGTPLALWTLFYFLRQAPSFEQLQWVSRS